MPIDALDISFAGVSLGRWAPGFNSQIAGKWAEHTLPHQKGALQEDLADGVLMTKLPLEFVAREGRSAKDWYDEVMDAITKTRRGTLVQPLRGSRPSILFDITESMAWTTTGNIIKVELTFKDANINLPSDFLGGPGRQAGEIRAQADTADTSAETMKTSIFGRFPPSTRPATPADIAKRVNATAAVAAVSDATAAARAYVVAAEGAQAAGLLGVDLRTSLQDLPPKVRAAEAALALVGGAGDIQATVNALELCLYAATQMDAAIQASQPLPIRTTVTAPMSIYQFVQAWYAGTGRTPAQVRELVQTILRLNRDLRTPSCLELGFVVVRPAA